MHVYLPPCSIVTLLCYVSIELKELLTYLLTSFVTMFLCAYNFVFDFNKNCPSILYRFRVVASYLSTVADFNLHNMQLAPLLGWPR